jgi:catechol 2,3-dioxygenase-like lactoylglutathione lyase family enzyme
MIDHVSVGVADLDRAARFYEAVLATLGLTRLVTRPATIGFGKSYPEFWVNLREGLTRAPHESGTGPAAARPRQILRGLRARSRRQPDRGGDVSASVNLGVVLA